MTKNFDALVNYFKNISEQKQTKIVKKILEFINEDTSAQEL